MRFVTIGKSTTNDYVVHGGNDGVVLLAALHYARVANMGVKIEEGTFLRIGDVEITGIVDGSFVIRDCKETVIKNES